MQEELNSILRKIKNRKAAELDEIPPEVWNTRKFDDILLRHCNAVYTQNTTYRWTKWSILPFPKKGDLRIAKNYHSIILTSITAKIYKALLRNCIEPKIEKIFWKNQNGFRRNRSMKLPILTVCRILEGVRAKIIEARILFADFSQAFDSIHREKMEQIFLAYGLHKETVEAIMMLYKNIKSKSPLTDGDSLLRHCSICIDYVLRTSIDLMKENCFKLTKERSRRYLAQTITDADDVDDRVLLANTPALAESLLRNLEQVAGSIGLHFNANKTKYTCFNQRDDISLTKGGPLKLVDKFIYLGRSV